MLSFEQEFGPSTVSAHCPATLTRSVSVSEKPPGPAPGMLRPTLMLLQVVQRLDWRHAIEPGDLFRLQKNRREARAALFTHQLGWEVRLLVGSQLEVVQTQACRDQEEVLATGERWKAALAEKRWR
jgi:hypothetical protein